MDPKCCSDLWILIGVPPRENLTQCDCVVILHKIITVTTVLVVTDGLYIIDLCLALLFYLIQIFPSHVIVYHGKCGMDMILNAFLYW